MPPEVVFLNGGFVPYDQAVVPVEDRGFLFADAIYEVIRCYGGRFFRLDDHLERLEQSAAALEIPLPYDRARWTQVLEELIRSERFRDAVVISGDRHVDVIVQSEKLTHSQVVKLISLVKKHLDVPATQVSVAYRP